MACGFCESALSNSVGTLLVDWVAKPVGRQFTYICRFHHNVEKLKKRKEDLKKSRDRLQHDIEDAERQLQEIEDDVKDLLSQADIILSDETLENEMQRNMRCFIWCPNWRRQYWLSKKAMKNTLVIGELIEKIAKFSQPGRVAYRSRSTNPTIEFLSSKDFMIFASSKKGFDQIIEALQDDKVSMIGLWGMPGVGKTTLVREVGIHAKKLNLFDEVVIATVSQKPNFDTIQDEIAKYLDFDMKNAQGRRSIQEFWSKLQKEKRILIILDDVWAKIDLKEQIGIPFADDHKGCKILLTTRRQHLCVTMECQRTILLGCLNDHEAWTLFNAKAGLNDSSNVIKHVASKVIKKCKGLPIAIVTLGSALKGKNLHRWEAAYRRLENRRLDDIEDIDEKNAYLVLEVSFDYLNDKETKMCFLLCSLFPEDHEIYVEELVRYAWGLELCKGMGSIEEVRSEVLAAMDILKDSCLLLNCGERHVKMHDLVRDVALWIASNRKEFSFMIKSDVVEMWPKEESLESYEAVSFNTSRIVELPKGLVCPNLKILLLGGDGNMITSSEFFEGMKALKACTLNSRLISPDAFQFQTNLRTLHLERCKLLDISVLGKLKKLEVLSFSCSDIKELPEEIGNLDNLKLLDLSYCVQLQRIPSQLIRRLSKLEELYLHGCQFLSWATENTVQEESFASLSELNSLSNLIILSLEVYSEDIPRDFVFCKLQRFYVCVGFGFSHFYQGKMDFEICPFSRSLKIKGSVIEACKQLFGVSESLNLKNVVGYQNLVPSLESGQVVFSKLTSLDLESCKHMKCLIDTTKQQELTNAFSNLLELSLTNMRGLEELCSGHQPQGVLLKLKTLTIDNCWDMTSGIPILQSLERLEVKYCDEMQVLFQIAELRSIQQGPSHYVCLQSLKVVRIDNCNKLRYLFPTSVAISLGQLETLNISDCLELEEIIPKTEVSNINLQSLSEVYVRGCNNMTSLSSLSHGQILEKLTTLKIRDCSRLEYTFPISMAEGLPQLHKVTLRGLPEFKGRNGNDIVLTLPSLQELKMRECPQFIISGKIQIAELRSIQLGPSHHVSLQSLKVVTIDYCNKLRYLFPTYVAESLGQLETLNISLCLELEEIIPKTEVSNINLQSLREVYICGCNNLTSLSSLSHGQILEKLTTLRIGDCSRLEYTFPISMAEGLPQLNKVTLERLPELKGRDGNDIVLTLPSLQELCVDDCPQLTPFIISAKIQVIEPIAIPNLDVPKKKEKLRLKEKETLKASKAEQKMNLLEKKAMSSRKHWFL
ncbi:probable disease resistance protein At4g27220 [Durio zibethinus]|uniref:Probable disease resistance protein At4g27220 n=1 Tax=Durio zibethinus TaxID=66656 RepID=A0A6P5ZLA0_DURZI|nr:probable disease resistance protein At4g27220 [Durio zibethinus]